MLFSEYNAFDINFPYEFCAGTLDNDNNGLTDADKDACGGDSGGPLICAINGKPILVGVVTRGESCGKEGYPGIYTSVAEYADWIDDITQREVRTVSIDYYLSDDYTYVPFEPKPVEDQPTDETLTAEKPVIEDPVVAEPVVAEPVVEEPVVEEQVTVPTDDSSNNAATVDINLSEPTTNGNPTVQAEEGVNMLFITTYTIFCILYIFRIWYVKNFL